MNLRRCVKPLVVAAAILGIAYGVPHASAPADTGWGFAHSSVSRPADTGWGFA